jgi:hypothetical protein
MAILQQEEQADSMPIPARLSDWKDFQTDWNRSRISGD